MCGFVTIVQDRDSSGIWNNGRCALSRIKHRGPDDCFDVVLDSSQQKVKANAPGRIYLGHRRLSILDLSQAGRQPMECSETGNLMVFNGEIYNFLELREELEKLGCVFRTDTDTEVILQGYRIWGDGAFSRFNGMWAIIIFDRASGTIVLSRDRLGVKPLYFTKTDRVTIFGSEISSIVAALGEVPAPDDEALFDFLIMGISDHTSRTFFKGISKIPPGEIVRLLPNGTLKRVTYHDWPIPSKISLCDPDEFRSLITDAVMIRLRSDAPTVSLLSGGLDSSIITWVSAKGRGQYRTQFHGAYTYGYSEEAMHEHDETLAARRFVAGIEPALPLHVHLASAIPNEAELFELVETLEEPPSTPSTLASFKLFRAIRDDGFKVVLLGEGADELFAGYTRAYLSRLVRDHLKNGNICSAVKLLSSNQIDPTLVLNRLIWELPVDLVESLLRQFRPNARATASGLWNRMGDRFHELCDDRRLPLSERLRLDVINTNLPMILRYTDRNSMRWGIEARSPYLDHRVVSLAMSLPLNAKVSHLGGKLLLRKAFDGVLPSEVIWKPKSHGFGNAEQFQIPAIKFQKLWENLPEWANEFVDVQLVRQLIERGERHPMLWTPLAVLLWFSVHYGMHRSNI